MIPIDELIEIWARVKDAHDDDLSWWREACQCLRPTAEDNEISKTKKKSARLLAPRTSRIVLLTFFLDGANVLWSPRIARFPSRRGCAKI
jgi:hypothetical protein